MQASCDSACQPQPITPRLRRAAGGEVPGRDAARRTGAQLAELVRLEHRDELRRVGAEEEDDEARAVAEARVDLRSRVAELEIGGGHDRERSFLEPEPVARPVLDAARRHAPEAGLDRLHCVGRREELGDVLLGRGRAAHHGFFLMKLIVPLVSSTAQRHILERARCPAARADSATSSRVSRSRFRFRSMALPSWTTIDRLPVEQRPQTREVEVEVRERATWSTRDRSDRQQRSGQRIVVLRESLLHCVAER